MKARLIRKPITFYSAHRSNLAIALVAVGAIVVVGAILLGVRAAGSVVPKEAESGTRATNAALIADTSASGGSAIKFTAPVVQGACASATPKVAGGADLWGGCFPGATTTGVPTGTTLTSYSGPCTITTANTVIDAKNITCDIEVRASGVQIKRSKITGIIWIDQVAYPSAYLTISDTEINAGNNAGTALSQGNFTAIRVHLYGGNRSSYCDNNCTIQDSYVHGQFWDNSGSYHESGIRMGQFTTVIHNSVRCDAPQIPPDGGCSAGLTGYGDWAPITNNLIKRNLFIEGTGAFCAYGGSSPGKAFSNAAHDISFIDNIFQKGPSGNCAIYDSHDAFCTFSNGVYTRPPGNVWTNNLWDDGSVVPDCPPNW
ncbi:MAG: hypothetical protein ABIR37_01020 [Candidatus Saccharimonadales bacterium]